MVLGLGPGHTVLDGDPPFPRKRGTAVPRTFRPMSVVTKLLISVTAQLVLSLMVYH